jgi:hypothetical protein
MHFSRRAPRPGNIFAAIAFLFVCALRGGESVPASTHSPDHRFGVTVPDEAAYDSVKSRPDGTPERFLHRLIEVKTRRVLAEIKAENGLDRMNHGGIAPRWTRDGSGLLWVIGGKWFPRAAVYLRISDGALAWQTDLLRSAQIEMLRRTKKAVQKTYAAAVEENKGSGSAYPDGFTIDITLPEKNPKLPLRFKTTLTSNPKSIDFFPLKAEVFARMNCVLETDGSISWSDYHVWTGTAARREYGASGE